MRVPDIIRKKQLGGTLEKDEISYIVQEYSSGRLPDYQMSALCMAIWFKGMSEKETSELTLAMAASGDQVDLSGIPGIKVDKHSSGGVADTTTIAVAPLVAACGGRVAKMSGRGLMHSGGTLDKLEAIPGYRVNQNMSDFARIVQTCGASIIGQTGDLVPADKKLYALRDVTSTVDTMPLIASSIMSKKLAAGSDKILLDVKWGSGAFMHSLEDAVELAEIMVSIGKHAGKPTKALVTDMNQPLGNAIGNALEIIEAIEIIRGTIEGDLKTLIMALAAEMLVMGEVCATQKEAYSRLNTVIENGEALKRLAWMIEMHGGDPRVCEDYSLLPQAREIVPVTAPVSGYITSMQTDEIGMSTVMIGAGREKKTDPVDYAVGCWMKCRLGDYVEAGDILAEFHLNARENFEAARNRFLAAIVISAEKPAEKPLICNIVT